MMKTIVIILGLSISFVAKPQVWISQNAVWHYEWSGVGFGGFEKIEYEKDTLINNKLCQKLIIVNYQFTINERNEIVSLGSQTLKSQYTYNNGDTVFYVVNGKFNVLYNFGAKPGDIWSLGVDANELQCSKSFVKIDSIGKILINSKEYRWISVSSLPNSSVGLDGKIIERFGAVNGYLFPTNKNCNSKIAVDFYAYKFTCFQDNNFPLYNTSGKDCEYLLSVDINELKKSIAIYPVPAKNKLIIDNTSGNEFVIKIYTLEGNEVYYNSKALKEIDISNLSEGIYFLVLTDKKNTVIKKIIKVK